MITWFHISPFQGLCFVALPLHRATPYVKVFCPFRVAIQSPERAEYNSEVVTPLAAKTSSRTSPERAAYTLTQGAALG